MTHPSTQPARVEDRAIQGREGSNVLPSNQDQMGSAERKTKGTGMNDMTKVKAGHANLNAALIAAQAEMPPPRKDREVSVRMKSGGTYKFSYATLACMADADKPILAKHGLGFVQFVADGAMVTRILHESGEHLDCPLPMLALPNAPQEAGSIITYFKRYSYAMAFGRVAEEEDDANIAAGNDYVPAHRAAGNGKVSDEQFSALQAAVDRTGADLARFCAYFKVVSLRDVPAARFQEALSALEAKAKRQPKPEPEMAK